MEKPKLLSQNNFSINNKKIKYRLLPNKKYLLTNKNLSLSKNKNIEKIINNITPYAIQIHEKITKKDPNSRQYKNNLINSKDNASLLHKQSFDGNIFRKKFLKKNDFSLLKDKSASNVKNELEKVKFRLICKLIENNYGNINDIDCILESPHRGIEKLRPSTKAFENNVIKRAISGYNIKNYKKISNPLKEIPKPMDFSSKFLKKVINYSLSCRNKNISKIINEKIKKHPILNKENIYLNIPLKNVKNDNNLYRNISFNNKKSKNKKDLVYFEPFIPEDFKITSKKLNKKIY